MTLLGKKNHHNGQAIERLGVSISLKENRIMLKGARDHLLAEQIFF
jgi:hypothetical protein